MICCYLHYLLPKFRQVNVYPVEVCPPTIAATTFNIFRISLWTKHYDGVYKEVDCNVGLTRLTKWQKYAVDE